MNTSQGYTLSVSVSAPWRVGYSISKDEIFIFKVDDDNIGWVYFRKGLDSCGPIEFYKFDDVLWLGEL